MSIEQLTDLARRIDYCAKRLAGALSLTPRTLARRFKVELNCSPGEWLAQRRMCDAIALLRGRLTVKEVAGALGYHQPPQFCREFRRRLGCTPSKFLAQHLNSPTVSWTMAETPSVSETANLLSETANAPVLPSGSETREHGRRWAPAIQRESTQIDPAKEARTLFLSGLPRSGARFLLPPLAPVL